MLCLTDIQELLMKRSVVALVNGKPWDMHRPLTADCTLSFCHFKEENPFHANNVNLYCSHFCCITYVLSPPCSHLVLCLQVFWRSCSFLLGYVLETAFKDNINVELCSFPSPNGNDIIWKTFFDNVFIQAFFNNVLVCFILTVRSGSFVYDAKLDVDDWRPNQVSSSCDVTTYETTCLYCVSRWSWTTCHE